MKNLNDPKNWLANYPVPDQYGHKYHRGHVGVFSGGLTSSGAGRLAAGAALRTGAGLVTVLSPQSALVANASQLTAVMLEKLDNPDEIDAIVKRRKINAFVCGPGLGVNPRTIEIVMNILSLDYAPNCGIVLDADALTSFSEDTETFFTLLKQARHQAVLTPHMGEFCRVFGGTNTDDLNERTERANDAAIKSNAIIVLKGHQTIIAAPQEAPVISQNAPPWLATAGSGDVLAGIIAGLLAQDMPPRQAAMAGVWLHSEAGNQAGPGLISEDLDQSLRQVIRKLRDGG